MKPDEKYMHQINLDDDDDINFIPPSFNKSLFRNEFNSNIYNTSNDILTPITNINTINSDITDNSYSRDESNLHCYYSGFGNCTNQINRDNIDYKVPTTFDILRNFDLDLDETTDLERNCGDTNVDKIYSEIEKNNPNVISTFCAYGIPCPISKVMIKRLIKLSLHYCCKK